MFVRAVPWLISVTFAAMLVLLVFSVAQKVQSESTKHGCHVFFEVNETEEVLRIPTLFNELKRQFATSHVRLLVLIDHQDLGLTSSSNRTNVMGKCSQRK